MARLAHASLLSLATLYYFAALGCSSSNDPSTPASNSAGTSSSTSTAGTGSSINVGGSSSAAGTTNSQTSGGSAAAGTASTRNEAEPAPGSGGSGGSEQRPGTASTGTAGSAATGSFMPICDGLMTAAAVAPTKAGACNATDPQLCYKTCGPQGVGFKSETCTAGAYAEQTGCTFPDNGEYSCFKVPTAVDAACPAETITASSACSVKSCTPCADKTGSYYDSKMTLKTGFCVCPEPSTPGGMSKWSCASNTAWPCPTGKGC